MQPQYSTDKIYDYHWLWDLRFSLFTKTSMLISIIEETLSNIDKQCLIKQSIEEINKYSIIVRFFYWVFNVNNYALNLYIMKNTQKPAPTESGSFLASLVHQYCPSWETLSRFAFWSTERSPAQATIEMQAHNDEEQAEILAASVRPVFHKPIQLAPLELDKIRVTYKNHQDLCILGFTELHLNDTITWTDFRKQFRKLVVKHHSDRGGDDETFRNFHEAYIRLLKAFGRPSNDEKDMPDLDELYDEAVKKPEDEREEDLSKIRQLEELIVYQNIAKLTDRLAVLAEKNQQLVNQLEQSGHRVEAELQFNHVVQDYTNSA